MCYLGRLKRLMDALYRRRIHFYCFFIQVMLGQSEEEYQRGNCGIMMYWRGRLISSYDRVGVQRTAASESSGRGIIGIVDTNTILTPTPNKQVFCSLTDCYLDECAFPRFLFTCF